jgi:hypothetical protein
LLPSRAVVAMPHPCHHHWWRVGGSRGVDNNTTADILPVCGSCRFRHSSCCYICIAVQLCCPVALYVPCCSGCAMFRCCAVALLLVLLSWGFLPSLSSRLVFFKPWAAPRTDDQAKGLVLVSQARAGNRMAGHLRACRLREASHLEGDQVLAPRWRRGGTVT